MEVRAKSKKEAVDKVKNLIDEDKIGDKELAEYGGYKIDKPLIIKQ